MVGRDKAEFDRQQGKGDLPQRTLHALWKPFGLWMIMLLPNAAQRSVECVKRSKGERQQTPAMPHLTATLKRNITD